MLFAHSNPQGKWGQVVGNIVSEWTQVLGLVLMTKKLIEAGSDKSKILDATLFLVHKEDFKAMNEAWDAWVSPGNAPVRCTVQANLMNPKYKIEIKIIAAR